MTRYGAIEFLEVVHAEDRANEEMVECFTYVIKFRPIRSNRHGYKFDKGGQVPFGGLENGEAAVCLSHVLEVESLIEKGGNGPIASFGQSSDQEDTGGWGHRAYVEYEFYRKIGECSRRHLGSCDYSCESSRNRYAGTKCLRWAISFEKRLEMSSASSTVGLSGVAETLRGMLTRC